MPLSSRKSGWGEISPEPRGDGRLMDMDLWYEAVPIVKGALIPGS